MQSFKTFMEQEEFVDFVLNEADAAIPIMQSQQMMKPWSAKKPEIIQMWKNMRPDMPIVMTPMLNDPNSKSHSTYGEDGIRITGSWNFISSIIARLKEVIGYENPQSKLRLIFRGVDKSKNHRVDRQSYVFYCNLEQRIAGPTKQKTITNAV